MQFNTRWADLMKKYPGRISVVAIDYPEDNAKYAPPDPLHTHTHTHPTHTPSESCLSLFLSRFFARARRSLSRSSSLSSLRTYVRCELMWHGTHCRYGIDDEVTKFASNHPKWAQECVRPQPPSPHQNGAKYSCDLRCLSGAGCKTHLEYRM